jgi:hypothetical protein
MCCDGFRDDTIPRESGVVVQQEGRKEGRKEDKARERKRNAHAGRQQTTEKETKAGKKERERQPT